jgi:hypothetical protein
MSQATPEALARAGLMTFAAGLQGIRDNQLYPDAPDPGAWRAYCEERWGMTGGAVDRLIRLYQWDEAGRAADEGRMTDEMRKFCREDLGQEVVDDLRRALGRNT